MKYLKLFEINSEVKENLSENDILDIIDVFVGYVSDKHRIHEANELGVWYSEHGLQLEGTDIYSYYYDRASKILSINIVKEKNSIKFSTKKFTSDVAEFKNRIKSFGYSCYGRMHASVNNLNLIYPIEIYRPMFPVKGSPSYFRKQWIR